jgi:hypothetical protein
MEETKGSHSFLSDAILPKIKNQNLLAQKDKEAQNSWQTKCSGQMPYQPVILWKPPLQM